MGKMHQQPRFYPPLTLMGVMPSSLCQPRPTILTFTKIEQICGKITVTNKAGSLAKKQHVQQLKQAR
ncbi:hypothetical protein VXS04_18530 [Photobacterium piscicola]|nr:hypothetical protein [Photobacterium piscicola]